MVKVTVRKNATYGITTAKYYAICSRCKGPVKIGEVCVQYKTRDGDIGFLCGVCKKKAEKKHL